MSLPHLHGAHLSIAEPLVALCADRAGIVVVLAAALGMAVFGYAFGHFAMTTDTYALLSPKLGWRVRETAFNNAFPQAGAKIVVIVDGRTPELGEAAAAALAQALSAKPKLFRVVHRPDAGPFWAHDGLLFAPLNDVQADMAQLIKAEPLLGPMAADPSIRGLMNALSTALQGVKSGQASLQDLHTPFLRLAGALASLRAGKPAFFSWRALIGAGKPGIRELRHVILVDPSLEFAQLEPGKAPTEAIRKAANALHLDDAHGVRVRLTGPVPLQDEEFATLADRAPLIAGLATVAIVTMLWMAVRSVWLIVSILATTLIGLVTATALGLAIFHRFNVISVAFIPLFVGLGIDIGIQFSVRYRAERGEQRKRAETLKRAEHAESGTRAAGPTVREALVCTGRGMGRSLTLAATAIAAGFFAFAPTDYYGVSQLGVIAGLGMIIALTLNLTLLPALIRLTRPPGAREKSTDPRLTLIDNFVLGRRWLVLRIAIAAALLSVASLPFLHFDFNPIHLRSPTVESVAALLDLMSDPSASPNTLEVVRPSLASAEKLAAKFKTLPEVFSARSLSSFIPADQAEKIAIIADADNLLDLTLNPVAVAAPPTDAQLIEALKLTAADLRQVARPHRPQVAEVPVRADASWLAAELEYLAQAAPGVRVQAAQLLVPGLATFLNQIRDSLQPQTISLATLPPDLVRDWLLPDGTARVSVSPKGDSNNNAVLSRFVAAGLGIAPDATGTAVSIQEGGRAVVRAFIEAGTLSFVAIVLLLLFALRRLRDVAITMAPILLTGLLTMGTCVLIGQSLNFANIIALPLLFGIGVAFHIYFVMSWRSGGSHLLTSSLARAVFFSALATATGFGSLWASSHPGTASMGELLMISLVWTLASALLFQPALMGPAPAVPAPES